MLLTGLRAQPVLLGLTGRFPFPGAGGRVDLRAGGRVDLPTSLDSLISCRRIVYTGAGFSDVLGVF